VIVADGVSSWDRACLGYDCPAHEKEAQDNQSIAKLYNGVHFRTETEKIYFYQLSGIALLLLLLLLFILVRNYIHVKSQEYKLKNRKSQE